MNRQPPPQSKELRFSAYLERAENRTVLRMRRAAWKVLKPRQGEPVLIDVSLTPMADVAKDATVVAATAHCISSSGVEVAIYRYDPNDVKPYNKDLYSVWEDLPSHSCYHSIVAAASTEDNENLRAFLSNNVFIVSQSKKGDHWLSKEELPSVVEAIIQVRSCEGTRHDSNK